MLSSAFAVALSGCALGQWTEVKSTEHVRDSLRTHEVARRREVVIERSPTELQVLLRDQVECETRGARVVSEQREEKREYNGVIMADMVWLVAGTFGPALLPPSDDPAVDSRGMMSLTLGGSAAIVLLVELSRSTQRQLTIESRPRYYRHPKSCPAELVAGIPVDLALSDGSKRSLRTDKNGLVRVDVAPELEVEVTVQGLLPVVSPAAR